MSVRSSSLARFAAIAAAGALALTACSNASTTNTGGGLNTSAAGSAGSSGATSGGGGGASGKTYKIAFQGVLSGDSQQLGINEVNAFRLAVKQANAGSDLGFKVEAIESDDGGAPATAPAAAAKIIQDPAVVGMIGPSFSGATKAVGKTYGDAGLVFITPSASNAQLQAQGFTTYHRIVPDDNVEAGQGAEWLKRSGTKNLFLVDDTTDYGKGVADAMENGMKGSDVKVTREGVSEKTTDYGAISQKVKSSGADTLFYAGYDTASALFARSLKSVGFTGKTATGNGGKSSVFTKGAGDAGNGWYFTCGCVDATIADSAKAFTKDYRAEFHTDPSTYSPESFDATNALLQAIKAAQAAGEVTRKSVLDAVNKLEYKGITTTVKFDEKGETTGETTIFLYRQEGGVIKSLGPLADQK